MRLSRGAGSPAFLSITSSSKDTSPRELLLATAELRKRQQNHAKEIAITGKRLAELLAQACAQEVVLTQRLQDVEAQDVFAQMGAMQALAPAKKSTAPMMPLGEDQRCEEGEDVYVGLEIYEQYQ